MDLANIEQLIEKYFAAETTIQEEKVLQDYFTSTNVAPHLQEYTVLFKYLKESKQDVYTKNIPLKTRKSFKWLSVAASVVLVFSVFIGKNQYEKHQQRAQLQKVKETLQLVSVNINKSNEAMEHLYTYEDTVNKILNQVSKNN